MNAIINFATNLIRGVASQQEVSPFHGGVHPTENKAQSTLHPIASLAIPEKLILPLRQHVGHLPKVKVQVGDYVLKGQMLAEPEGNVSAAIHAPTSGTISAIDEQIIPHPSGLPDLCISLIPDGKDQWGKLEPIDWRTTDWRTIDKKDLVASLRSSGIVGFGGATFPTHIKLTPHGKSNVHTLIINAAECEPYITCDDMLMRERADEIIKGIAIAQHLLGANKCIIGIEDNKPEAANAMTEACKKFATLAAEDSIKPEVAVKSQITVKVVPTLYPSGDARHLVYLLLGTEIPSDKRTTDMGLQVFNVATVLALHRYFEFGEPSISRIVSMTGNVARPQNFEVLFGTPLQSLVTAAGGTKVGTTHFIMGGPMMGFDLPNDQVPITKAANCIIAAAPNLFSNPPPAMPCIRCTRCADACPVSLQPQELYWFAKSDNFEKARDYNLFDCIECGCCTYVCPSSIPLVQYYRYAKSEIIAADKAKEASDLARERNEFRLARIEREKLERAQKHAERAQAAKAEAKKEPVKTDSKNTEEAPSLSHSISNATPETNDKQAAIAAAVARAKAQKLAAASNAVEAPTENSVATNPETQAAEIKAKQDKQAVIAAAIERAKAQKLAAAQAGIAPKNIDNVSAAVQTEINKTDELREKAQQITRTQTESTKE